jgi:hypothetical protein
MEAAREASLASIVFVTVVGFLDAFARNTVGAVRPAREILQAATLAAERAPSRVHGMAATEDAARNLSLPRHAPYSI